MCSVDYKVEFINVKSDDAVNLKKVQAKINQWITKGELKKYEVHTAGDYIFFNICRVK